MSQGRMMGQPSPCRTQWMAQVIPWTQEKQKQKAAQDQHAQTPVNATNTNQGSVNQGKSIHGSMHHGTANMTLPSLSQIFCHTCVTFNDISDDDSVWSFGQTLFKCLLPLLLFSVPCPRRDTQDDGLTHCIGNVYGPYYMSYFFSLLSSLWSIFATKLVMVLGIIYAAFSIWASETQFRLLRGSMVNGDCQESYLCSWWCYLAST